MGSNHCHNCFSQLPQGAALCPQCGYNPAADAGKYPLALPAGSILNGRYILGRVLGQGGFGITYIAQDVQADRIVAIKEFFPETMATRTGSHSVTAFSGQRQENFSYGIQCFLSEAQTLAQFIGNENVVQVYSYFEENGTAYFVMEYIEGTSFQSYLNQRGGKITWEEVTKILFPIMDALGTVHSKGIIHRDISPDNIYITKDGKVKLLDFGAARYSLGDRSHSLDVVLKAGFAPKEQYTRRGRQGPYTDVYSMAATIYYALTHRLPPESVDRTDADEDELILPSSCGAKLPPEAEEALEKGLAVRAPDRFQTMGDFRRALEGGVLYAPTDRKPDAGPEIPVSQHHSEERPPVHKSITPEPLSFEDKILGKPLPKPPTPQPEGKPPIQPQPPVQIPDGAKPIHSQPEKKAPTGVIIAAIVAVIAAALYWGVPYFQYTSACSALEQGRYEDAYSAFLDLEDYKDSPTMAKEARYQKGMKYLRSGEYAIAYSSLSYLDGLRDSDERLAECIYSWAEDILADGNTASADTFKRNVTLKESHYFQIYDIIYRQLNAHGDYKYWMGGYKTATDTTKVMNILLQMLPASYEDVGPMQDLFEDLSAGEAYPVSTYIRKNKKLLESVWHLPFIQNLLTSDDGIYAFLEGNWSTSDNKYYLNFTEASGGTTNSEYNLPWVAKPSGTKYFGIRDLIYMHLDGDSKELAKVFQFTVEDFDTMSVYCYKDKKTYRLTR